MPGCIASPTLVKNSTSKILAVMKKCSAKVIANHRAHCIWKKCFQYNNSFMYISEMN